LNRLRLSLELLAIASTRFVLHDAWAIASHIALSVLTGVTASANAFDAKSFFAQFEGNSTQ